jgi:hypothetical protein
MFLSRERLRRFGYPNMDPAARAYASGFFGPEMRVGMPENGGSLTAI